jgi:hypothetical protein
MARPGLYVQTRGTVGLARAAAKFTTEGYALFLGELTKAGERVKQGVQERYLTVNQQPDVRGAGGITLRTGLRGAEVGQSIRKSEDASLRRPNYGPRMMLKAFIPALKAERTYVVVQAKAALETAKALYWRS